MDLKSNYMYKLHKKLLFFLFICKSCQCLKMITNRSLNLGTETAFSVLAKANKLSEQGKEIINLGIGQPDFLTPEHIVEAGIKALRDGHHG